jgi:Response regulator containing a CheY-like receiver domain and an HTH DNA-binding domain
MKKIVDPFYVIQVLLLFVLITGCIRHTSGSFLTYSYFMYWQTGIVLLLLIMTSVSMVLYYRYRMMEKHIKREKEIAYQEAHRLVELEKQRAMHMANMLIEEKKQMAVQQAHAIVQQAMEQARQLQTQVTTASVMLANKNDYLLQLQQKLKTADHTDFRRIAKEIKTNLTETDHWSDFIRNFNLLHSHCVDRIVKAHPGLTPNEVRLICFILSGLSNKEIAGIFSVEPESVKKARYRLKKKLHLKEEESLNYYLHNLC